MPLAAEAQQTAKVPRIGIVGNAPTALWEAFEQGLKKLGYVPNQSIALEYRWSEGKPERFPALVSDLVGRKVDVLVVVGESGARAAKQATANIPIVMLATADPVASGLVASFARPGGNITGLLSAPTELNGKRLELLKELVPGLSRVAVLGHATDPAVARLFKETQNAATVLNLTVQVHRVSEPMELESAFAEIGRAGPGGLFVIPNPFMFINRAKIAELAAKSRVPAVYGFRENVEAGGLMSYASDLREIWVRGATYVDKILKGAKPGELPIEQPTKYELVINLKTARALGITIPQLVLLRADRVIE